MRLWTLTGGFSAASWSYTECKYYIIIVNITNTREIVEMENS